MKTILSLLFIFTIIICTSTKCETIKPDNSAAEINLDMGYTVKQYNLKKTNHDNGEQKKYDNYDNDDDMLLNNTSPLQLLKQYQMDNH